jgi:NAD(P)-dependent dehydrogenase (short-subunit alcohol dehydrogenase family)
MCSSARARSFQPSRRIASEKCALAGRNESFHSTPMSASKFIVVTGVSRGCGRALVEWLIEQGHTVAGCARSADAVGELREQFPAPHRFDTVDLGDAAATTAWATEVIKSHRAPDFLVNNAAVIARNAPLWEVPASEADAVLRVNIGGTINAIRGFVPAMVKARKGVIVNYSSGWGRSTSPEVAVYCASKFAVEGLTQALAQELPDGVAAVALNPGVINTEMLRECFGGAASNYPKPSEWARRAGPFLLRLSARDNGRSLDVPGVPVD